MEPKRIQRNAVAIDVSASSAALNSGRRTTRIGGLRGLHIGFRYLIPFSRCPRALDCDHALRVDLRASYVTFQRRHRRSVCEVSGRVVR